MAYPLSLLSLINEEKKASAGAAGKAEEEEENSDDRISLSKFEALQASLSAAKAEAAKAKRRGTIAEHKLKKMLETLQTSGIDIRSDSYGDDDDNDDFGSAGAAAGGLAGQER